MCLPYCLQVLAVNAFNADRKRMSILIRDSISGEFLVMCKGSMPTTWVPKYHPSDLLNKRDRYTYIHILFLLHMFMYVFVYVGADNIMLPLCTVSNDVAQLQSVNKSLDDLSNMGLRSHAYIHAYISTYIYDIHISI